MKKKSTARKQVIAIDAKLAKEYSAACWRAGFFRQARLERIIREDLQRLAMEAGK